MGTKKVAPGVQDLASTPTNPRWGRVLSVYDTRVHACMHVRTCDSIAGMHAYTRARAHTHNTHTRTQIHGRTFACKRSQHVHTHMLVSWTGLGFRV